MENEADKAPANRPDQYVLRFCEAGHRQRLKAQAKLEKRSLNNYLLLLLEAGEKAINKPKGAQA